MVTNECIKSSCRVFIIKQKNNFKASLAQCLCSVYRPLWSHKCIKCSCFVCILKLVRQIWGKVPGGPGIKSSQSCSNSPAIARQSPRMSRGWGGGGGNKWLVYYRAVSPLWCCQSGLFQVVLTISIQPLEWDLGGHRYFLELLIWQNMSFRLLKEWLIE